MINQFKFKFTCDMYQAMTEKGQGGYGSSDDNPKATITQQKQNK